MNPVMNVLSRLPYPVRIGLRCWFYRTFGRPKTQLESTKARGRREKEGFFTAYCQGRGLDIGYGGDLLVPNCQGWDMEHGDAQLLQGLKNESYDFVYSSHTLEHMVDPVVALRNWWRVLKPSGYLLLYIPHRDLYEKRECLPSRWNLDHKHFFLLGRDALPDTKDIMRLIAESFTDYQVIYAKECSDGHTITVPDLHSDGEYSIEVVLKKSA